MTQASGVKSVEAVNQNLIDAQQSFGKDFYHTCNVKSARGRVDNDDIDSVAGQFRINANFDLGRRSFFYMYFAYSCQLLRHSPFTPDQR